MKKKEYIKPQVNVIMMEAESLLAGSNYDYIDRADEFNDPSEEGWNKDSSNKLWID